MIVISKHPKFTKAHQPLVDRHRFVVMNLGTRVLLLGYCHVSVAAQRCWMKRLPSLCQVGMLPGAVKNSRPEYGC